MGSMPLLSLDNAIVAYSLELLETNINAPEF
jgi:hypothetical protein